uniref:NADP-dependent oxidoreductase domain-containing protein n=1 Tax=Parascaris univalens TaxID=6257 RepID=A0A915CKN4_PARUN
MQRVVKISPISENLVLLAWAHGIGVGIVPKSANPSRVVENFKVVELKLSQEELAEIGKLDRNKHYIRCDGWNVL